MATSIVALIRTMKMADETGKNGGTGVAECEKQYHFEHLVQK
jgi:hypothetical protein